MNDVVKKNISAYDLTVDQYSENTKNLEEPEMEHRNKFLSLIPEGGRILDLGCGPGRDSKIFSDRGYDVIGVDLSVKTIEKAKQNVPNVVFKVMDFLSLDFEKEYFDGVWFNACLLCVEKKFASEIFQSIFNILVEKGIFFVSVKEGEGEGFRFDKRYNVEKYEAYYNVEELLNILKSLNFLEIEVLKPNLKSTYHERQWIDIFCSKLSKN
ncbi:MAG: methyltransferase type 11 [uncultured bacterium]|nr:MAG: methyltransferase type 11 [uncultured bacterium]